MAKTKTTTSTSARKAPILRFAHPFFTTTPPEARAPVPGFGKQLLTHIQGKLLPIPAAKRTPTMTLADVIGAQGEADVTNSGSISFHAVGDTGKSANSPQGAVAEAMATDLGATLEQAHTACDAAPEGCWGCPARPTGTPPPSRSRRSDARPR